MKLLICPDPAQAVHKAACVVQKQVRDEPDSVLGLATGGTMEALYRILVADHRRTGLSYAQARTFNLDEYLGLHPQHPQSYHHFMHSKLFQHLDIASQNIHLLSGLCSDVELEAERYEQAIAQCGGIDLQLLGLGSNGHIGFNEPSSSLASRTRVKRLARSTIAANRRFFGEDETPPHYALTMGIGTIMQARQIVVLALGTHKAKAVAQMVEGPVSAWCPASILQMHPHVSVIVDRDAAQELSCQDYYLDVHPFEQVDGTLP